MTVLKEMEEAVKKSSEYFHIFKLGQIRKNGNVFVVRASTDIFPIKLHAFA